jgi:hypothetical protein
MKIDSKFINNIFCRKIKLTKIEDKMKLSLYEEQIPMYDIYSKEIYPINKKNIHSRLIEYHYRFINKEVYEWIKLLHDKNIKNIELATKYSNLLKIMDNYDINTLIETSYKTLYKYSPSLGLLVSICKRNSFHPYINHLKPYYTKLELIKLGQNMSLIKKNIMPDDLMDQTMHYNVCKAVSNNDVSFTELELHHNHIINTNCISWITFYSHNGSFLFNKYLRNNIMMQPFLYNGIKKINECIKNAPALSNEYDIYRFIWDDKFLNDLAIGDIFIDKGFVSTTRDPFYSPGLNGNFGLVLLKIKIPKNKKGVGLFIENFSLFPKEEEFLLPPNTKLKLLSRDENFKYFHTNSDFEKIINRKYEFELIETDWSVVDMIEPFKIKEEFHSIKNINISGNNRVNIIKQFLKNYINENSQICIKINDTKYKINYHWFDTITTQSYEKLYYNKIIDGIMFSVFDENGYPFINIELGNKLVINYLNRFFYYKTKQDLDNKHLELILEFGRIFNYKKCIIFNNFNNFANIKDYNENMFLYTSFYDKTLYDYIKTNRYYLKDPYVTYESGYWKLDDFLKKEPDNDIVNKLPEKFKKIKTNAQLIIDLVEKDFYLYLKVINNFDTDIFNNCYVVYNIYEMLVSQKRINIVHNMNYTDEEDMDDNYKLVFRQPIRRL